MLLAVSGLAHVGSQTGLLPTAAYRRVIWQCNAKFKSKKRCRTPHLSEDEIKEAFIRAANRMVGDREFLLEDLRNVQSTLSGTEELEQEQRRLVEQMNVDADAVEQLIAENARAEQDQEAYRIRYDALASRYEETNRKYDEVTQEIAARGIRKQEFERFIENLKTMPDTITEFDEILWGSMVDHMTVKSKEDIVFTMRNGMEIKA